MKIVTAAQMRAIEDELFASGRVTVPELMRQAGEAVASAARRLLPQPDEATALVLVGPGKNGGDGLVAAEALLAAGLREVTIWLYHREGTGEAPVIETLLARVRVVTGDVAGELGAALAGVDLIVDAVYGLGQRDDLPNDLVAVLEAVNARGQDPAVYCVALDLPTGLNADSGGVARTAFRADLTVTLGRPKRGLYLAPGLRYAGRIEVATLGLDDASVPDDAPRLIVRADAAARLPHRPADAHKGSAGSLLVIGGSANYLGAPVLAAHAALRAGVGLVTLAAPRGIVIAAAAQAPEATYLPLPEADWGIVGPNAAKIVTEALARYTAVQVGNGLGREKETAAFLSRLFGVGETVRGKAPLGFGVAIGPPPAPAPPKLTVPVLFDADGLNWLSTVENWATFLRELRLVLTPHPGEMARLRAIETAAVVADPWGTARDAAREWGQTVVLKGAHTVVATACGELWVSPLANPALGVAGTGDILAGLIGGLLAQHLTPDDAAIAGLYLGTRAGELARAELGVRPLIASDLPHYLGQAVRELEKPSYHRDGAGEAVVSPGRCAARR